MNAIWIWGWLGLAIIFLIAELFTTGFFLLAFGIGAGAAAIAAYLGVDPFLQVLIFILVSGAAVPAYKTAERA